MILVYISIQFIHLENFFHPVSQNIFISREEGDKKEKKFTVSSIHSNQKRNPPSLITIQIGPWWPRTTVSCRINIQPSSEARAKFSLCTIGPLGVHSFEWDRSVDLIGLLCNYFINEPEAEGEGGGAKPPEVVTGFGGEKRRKEKTEGRRAGADIYPAIDLLERVTRTPSIRALVSCLP